MTLVLEGNGFRLAVHIDAIWILIAEGVSLKVHNTCLICPEKT